MRRPWNMIDMPVYSLATYTDSVFNMNISTYVQPVSMKPKIYMIAVYHGTRTLDILEQSQFAVLQLLSVKHKKLIRPLGKKSGRNYNKQAYLQKNDWLTQWKGVSVLRDCSALLYLEKKDSIEIGGDHRLFWFDVKGSRSINDQNILYFQDLISEGLIMG
ncbi:MAG: flavin reductase family protein [Bacteroidia bacterium]|nr:flavin reductase family protein [Bacteroidia bacterium]